MTNIVSIWTSIKQARLDAEKEIISENMVGIDFSTLLSECKPSTIIMRLTEDFGAYEMEFKKGEW